jgi:hypothetical protein
MRFHCGGPRREEELYNIKQMWHTAFVSRCLAMLLLWIERRVARLRRLIASPVRQPFQAPSVVPGAFDRRDLRARW